MERLTNRNKEIPLPCPENALFWGRVHEKLARYEDLEEQAKPKTLCEKWPSFCCSCIIENCDGKKDIPAVKMYGPAELEIEANNLLRKMIGAEPYKAPATNADKLRAMTDEELAEFLNGTDGDFLPTGEALTVSAGKNRWLDWLKEEITDG